MGLGAGEWDRVYGGPPTARGHCIGRLGIRECHPVPTDVVPSRVEWHDKLRPPVSLKCDKLV